MLFPKARIPTKEAVIATLSTIRSAKVTDLGDMEFTVVTDGGTFDVSLNTLAYVLEETRFVVDENRKSVERADEIATYDARFELLFDERDMASGDIFNPLLAAAERLEKLTSGVVYETNTGEFQ
ncbi:MAG: hypothetical protein JO257_22965 [Deltaproteobacteria bacterium]|nr:hypothetical protein [Deltaproteobacteria bacterium]